MDNHYKFLFTPLVLASGLGRPSSSDQQSGPQPFPVVNVPLGLGTVDYPVINALRKELMARSREPGPWQYPPSKPGLYFKLCDEAQLYSKKEKPSALSPKHEDGVLYPDKLFTAKWIEKYLYFMPTTVMVWIDASDRVREEDAIDRLLKIKHTLSAYDIHLIAVLVGTEADLASRAPIIRRATGLQPRTGLLAVAEDYSPKEVVTFVDSVWPLLISQAEDFYTLRLREIRRKRNSVDPSLNFLLWDARYTIKMACFAEFKGDYSSAIKLYESAYDSVLLLFDNDELDMEGTNAKPSAYVNARESLDVVALKIAQSALAIGDQALAERKFDIHLLSVKHYTSKAGFEWSYNWEATQYMRLANLLSLYPRARAGSAGLLYLKAATVFMSPPPPESTSPDPYSPYGDGTEEAFLSAISNFVGVPNCRGYALIRYGDWKKSRGDPSAANETYKTAATHLKTSNWPLLAEYVAEKMSDVGIQSASATLWQLGKTSTLIGEPNEPLFSVTGCFGQKSIYIGRKMPTQLTFRSHFANNLKLDLIRVIFSVVQVEIRHSDSENISNLQRLELEGDSSRPDRLVAQANLNFDGKDVRIFEFAFSGSEPGDLEIEGVEICRNTTTGDESPFMQRLPVGAEQKWIKAWPMTPANVRHMAPNDPSTAIIETRPALIDVIPRTEAVAAPGERLPYLFEITNKEGEELKLSIKVTGDDSYEVKHEITLPEEGSTKIDGIITAPSSAFNLVVSAQYLTAADKLPVTKQVVLPIEVLRPFRVNFDLLPLLEEAEWPNFFASIGEESPVISRSWRLVASILALPRTDDKFKVVNTTVSLTAAQAEIDVLEETAHGPDRPLAHNDHFKASHAFRVKAIKQTEDEHIPRLLNAQAHLTIKWSRASAPDIVNEFVAPPIRLSLPSHEPRALVYRGPKTDADDSAVVQYWIENATSRCLDFAVSTASSTYFAFQGPKAVTIRLLPYSRRCLTYEMYPMGQAAVRGMRPLPEFRAFDTNYKRALAILPGSKDIFLEQGTLFI